MKKLFLKRVGDLQLGDKVKDNQGTEYRVMTPCKKRISPLARVCAQALTGDDAGKTIFLFSEDINWSAGVLRADESPDENPASPRLRRDKGECA